MSRPETDRGQQAAGSKPAGRWLRVVGSLVLLPYVVIPVALAFGFAEEESDDPGTLRWLLVPAIVGVLGLLAWPRPLLAGGVLVALDLSILLLIATPGVNIITDERVALAVLGIFPFPVAAGILFIAAGLRRGRESVPRRTWRTTLVLLLVAVYWCGLGVYLGNAFVNASEVSCIEAGDCGDRTDNWGALMALTVVAFLFALLVFARSDRLWRLVVFGIQVVLTALVVSLALSEDMPGSQSGKRAFSLVAIGAELAALLAIVISWPRSSAHASDGT